jgi:hypothetical protein
MERVLCRCRDGEMVGYEEPVWEPLLGVVGERLTGTFMCMYMVHLENGIVLHAYKHIYTRCYLFLTDGGRAYSWTPCQRYAPMRLDWAIEAALCSWWFLDGWDADDAAAIHDAIRRANRTASRYNGV